MNVWRPWMKPAQPLPVMVWLTGGGNQVVGARIARFRRTDLQRRELRSAGRGIRQLQFAAWRSRLSGASRAGRRASEKISGNYGSLDQIAMLRWLKANIAAFGGAQTRSSCSALPRAAATSAL